MKIIILVFSCGGLVSTIFFLVWYNSDKAKINKKIKYFNIKGVYPNDSQSTSYWDAQGWTEDAYKKFPNHQKEPMLYANQLFIEELKTNETIFKYFKLSILFVISSFIIGGLILEHVIK